MKDSIKLAIIALVMVSVLIGFTIGKMSSDNNGTKQLSASQMDWKECRTKAWDGCKTYLEKFKYNLACENQDLGIFNYSESPNIELARGFLGSCEIMQELSSRCWNAQAELCDSQFDMNKIKTAKLELITGK